MPDEVHTPDPTRFGEAVARDAGSDDVRALMTYYPPDFGPLAGAYFVGVKETGEEFTLFGAQEKTFWPRFLSTLAVVTWDYATMSEEERLALYASHSQPPESPGMNYVDTCESEIAGDTGQMIIEGWNAMLMKARSDALGGGFHGEVWRFSAGRLGGSAWSPIDETNSADLVAIGDMMFDLCEYGTLFGLREPSLRRHIRNLLANVAALGE